MGLVTLNSNAVSNCSGSALRYYLDPFCWEYSRSAWNEMAQFPQPPQPAGVPAVSAGTSKTPAPYTQAEYEAAVAEAIAQGDAATKARYQEFFASVPEVGKAESQSYGLVMAAAAVGIISVFVLMRKK